MIDTAKIRTVFFVGIGGIGMSALARYYMAGGFDVYGYDKTPTRMTSSLSAEGCKITFKDDPESLPAIIRSGRNIESVLVIYTPAIPAENNIISYFRNRGYKIYKRSEILGEISERTDTLAVSGTHGKTTVSTLLAHLLVQSEAGCSAFLGGISKNYNSNLIIGESKYMVIEADEFDRSFHRLRPLMAIVTSVDADHLDIYGNYESMLGAYNEFIARIRPAGKVVINTRIKDKLTIPAGISCFTYGLENEADFSARNIRQSNEYYLFDLVFPDGIIIDIKFPFPGKINIENATAAASVAFLCSISEQELRKGLLTFSGVQRRFDIRVRKPGLVYIDDYAHHPEEIRVCITSVREFFGSRKITGIFQPHLFTRTRDHAEGFAEILDNLDEVILLPVYPAREKPIEGISSSTILDRMKLKNKKLMNIEDVVSCLVPSELDVLLTIGAGDIDTLVKPIEELLNS
jgi:UDP-N-acetylmuramate--alanine ligase